MKVSLFRYFYVGLFMHVSLCRSLHAGIFM